MTARSRPLASGATSLLPLVALLAMTACEPRRDVADMAVGMAPFEELRGMGLRTMRAGMVRAFRPRAERAPWEGFRERIGAFDVVYGVPGFVGADSTWPDEDALIEEIEATREWPSDSIARAAFDAAVSEYAGLSSSPPACLQVSGPGFSMRVAEWDLGEGFAFSASLAPENRLTDGTKLSARHALAVRRRSLRDRLPAAGAPNPDDHPTWQPVSCDAQ